MPEIQEFDKTVQVRDKIGKIIEEKHYALHIIDETRYFEQPIGSGNLFYENAEPAGRLVRGKVEVGAAHLDYEAPLTGAAKAERDLALERAKNAELMRELEALRLEKEKEDLAQAVVDKAKAEAKKSSSKFAAHSKE